MKKPWIITALGLTACVSLLFGGMLVGWWSQGGDGLRTFVGLRDAQLCRDGTCASVPLHKLGGTQDLGWIRAGLAAYAAAWIAAVLCLALAAAAAAGKGLPPMLARTALVAVVSAAVVGMLFLLQAPSYVSGSPGPGMGLYFGGTLAGAVTAVLALRRG